MAKRIPLARDGQPLNTHLQSVAVLAEQYAQPWGCSHAYLAGLWHDLGKYTDAFQHYIHPRAGETKQETNRRRQRERGSVVHSTAGALHSVAQWCETHGVAYIDRAYLLPDGLRAIMLAILAHHGRLPDEMRFDERLGFNVPDRSRVCAGRLEYDNALRNRPPADILVCDRIKDAAFRRDCKAHPLLARMLLSVLCDADVADSSGREPAALMSLTELKARFDQNIRDYAQRTEIGLLRGEVLTEVRKNAGLKHGSFRLDAPTAFGKTFAALAFALDHAVQHGMERIIYVAPHLTAIEQTAAVFRDVLGLTGDRVTVLEAHSTAERDMERVSGALASDAPEDKAEAPQAMAMRDLLRENWEARLIVTSNVQFFESLHAHDRGRCRKLHRIANAVILIDEAQTLPLSLYAPTFSTLRALVRSYGSSLVFVTATQPPMMFDRDVFPYGLRKVTSLLPDELLVRLRQVGSRRVRVTLPKKGQTMTIEQVADAIAKRSKATLCIVNTRDEAQRLYWATKNNSALIGPVFHLSASMCPQHRREVVRTIKDLMKHNPVKVISTQVMEAGVDISFPVVMRALAGVDSLIQSSGRCNRNNEAEAGEFIIFEFAHGVPQIFGKEAAETRRLLVEDGMDLFDPMTASKFYEAMRRTTGLSEHLARQQSVWNLTEVGRRYRLIEPTVTVLVPYDEVSTARVAEFLAACAAIQADGRVTFRSVDVADVSINVHDDLAVKLQDLSLVEVHAPTGVLLLTQAGQAHYRQEVGLVLPPV